MTILHVFNDDKFIDIAFDSFEFIDNEICQMYVFYTEDRDYKFKYIKKTDRIILVNDYKAYLDYFSNPTIDIIFFHSISPTWYEFFKYIDRHKVVVWSVWGYDIYQNDYINPIVLINNYKPLTSKLLGINAPSSLRKLKRIIKKTYFIRKTIREIINDYKASQITKCVISRVNYCATVLPEEYMVLKRKKYFNAKKFNFRYFDYTSIHDTDPDYCVGLNILVGNSATATNNHLDVLDILKGCASKYQKIIIPLNYGDDEYKKKIMEKLCDYNLVSIEVLDNFLDYNSYKVVLKSCSFFIFGHVRQQALGNIYMALAMGGKVFLYEESFAYKYLTNIGYMIYTIDNDLSQIELSTPLSLEERKNNFIKYHGEFSGEAIADFKNSIASLKAEL